MPAAPATEVPLAPLTTLRLGGPARRLIEAAGEDELVAAVRAADSSGEPLLLLAGGSNVVVADDGFPGTVVRVLARGIEWGERDGRVTLRVAAGEPWDDVVAATVKRELRGLECLSGIPGSSGATPIQNVGAYGQEVAATISAVRVLDRRSGEIEELPPEACGFGYRTSAFKHRDTHAVLAVTFELERAAGESEPLRYGELARALRREPGETAALAEVREAVLALRRGKGMVIDPADPDSVSAGSFFTNPVLEAADFDALERRALARLGPDARVPRFPEPDGRVKTSAAWLIERSGFQKGYGHGSVGISSKHTLALVNRGGGTAAELLALAREIAGGVEQAFGVRLAPEPVLIGRVEWRPPG